MKRTKQLDRLLNDHATMDGRYTLVRVHTAIRGSV